MGRDQRYERRLKQHLEELGVRRPTKRELRLKQQWLLESRLAPSNALVLGQNPENGEAVYFQPKDFETHVHIVGWTRKGKTNLLKHMAKSLLDRRDETGEGLAILDPHGGLAEYVLALCAAKGPEFADKVVYFNLREDGKVPVFNPLRREYGNENVAKGFVEAIAKSEGHQSPMETPLISGVLMQTVHVLLDNDLSLAEAGFLTRHTEVNLKVRKQLLAAVEEKSVEDYWLDLGRQSPREMRLETEAAARRFDNLLNIPTLKRILGQCESGINLGTVMDEGQIAIFNLAVEGTDVPISTRDLLGALLMQEFRAVTQRRTPDVSLPFHLIVDEFARFVSLDIMDVFAEAAKFGLRCVLAHQGMSQLVFKNGGMGLHEAVKSIDQKVVFGGGNFDDHVVIAHQTHGPFLDAYKKKVEIRHTVWDPVLRKVRLKAASRAFGHTSGSGGSRTAAYGSGDSTSVGRVTPPEPMEGDTVTDQRTTASSEAHSETELWNEAYSQVETEGWSESFVTDHIKRDQLSSVQFMTLEEQVAEKAQRTHRQEVGYCEVAKTGQKPQPCKVPLMEKVPVSEEERLAFLDRVYEKPCYLTPAEADLQIETRKQRLLTGSVAKIEEFEPEEVWEVEEQLKLPAKAVPEEKREVRTFDPEDAWEVEGEGSLA